MRLRVAKKLVRYRRGRLPSVIRAYGVVRSRRRRHVPRDNPDLGPLFGLPSHPMYHVLMGGRAVPAHDVIDWGLFFETPRVRQIAHAYLGHYRVSTVFLGVGTSPEFFETMVFDCRTGLCDDSFETKQYMTAAEARAGHAATWAEVFARVQLEEPPS